MVAEPTMHFRYSLSAKLNPETSRESPRSAAARIPVSAPNALPLTEYTTVGSQGAKCDA